MIYIGNDIISLTKKDKILSFHDCNFIIFFKFDTIDGLNAMKTETPSYLWAVKQAAYKCVRKMGYKVAFSPAKYIISGTTTENKLHGTITYRDETLYFKCTEDGYYARAVVSNDQDTVHLIKSIHLKKTVNFQQQLLEKIANLTLCNKPDIKIHYENNPIVLLNKGSNFLEISLSEEEELVYISLLPIWFQTSKIKSTGQEHHTI